jgi:hypothetical protein
MLGRLCMDVEECIVTYCDLMDTVFQKSSGIRLPISFKTFKIKPKYSTKALRKAVVSVLESKAYTSGTSLLDEKASGLQCKTFVCAMAKGTGSIHRLKTYRYQADYSILNPTICDAIMATAAATSFFEVAKIGAQEFIDGALGANNPVFEVTNEAGALWGTDFDASAEEFTQCIVSIGTGHPGKEAFKDTASGIIGSLTKLATECDAVNDKFLGQWRKAFDEQRTFRFNVQQGLQGMKLDKVEERGPLEQATDEYLREPEQVRNLKRCVLSLCEDGKLAHSLAR